MSSGGKLWFEMGVRNDVIKEMERTRKEIMDTAKQVDDLTNRFEMSAKAGYKIKESISKLEQSISKGKKFNLDITDLQKAKVELEQFYKKVMSFSKTGKHSDVGKLMGADFQQMMKDVAGLSSKMDSEANRIKTSSERIKKALYSLKDKQDSAIGKYMTASSLGLNTANIEKAEQRIAMLIKRLSGFSSQGGVGNVKALEVFNSAKVQREIELCNQLIKTQERLNLAKQKADDKKLTQAIKDQEKAQRDAAKADARSLENKERLKTKYLELIQVLRRMRAASAKGTDLGLDTSKLDAKIKQFGILAGKMQRLYNGKGLLNDVRLNKFVNPNSAEQTRRLHEAAKAQEELNRAEQRNKAEKVAQAQREKSKALEESKRIAQQNVQANQDLARSYERLSEASSKSNKHIREMMSYAATFVSFYGLKDLLTQVITVGGEFEKQKIALESILGDAKQAAELYNNTKNLAVKSPFSFMQLTSYTKQLAAFNVEYEDLQDTTKRLADLSAGLGVDMNRLILAYGQVKSAAVLRGQELRQFTEAGIPMVQALADKFTKMNGKLTTTADIFELISERKVPFEMVRDVLWDMTNEGGKFYNMQYVLSDTLAGKWSNLRDAWEIMLSEFAKGSSISGKALKLMVSGLTSAINAANTLSPILAGLAAHFLLFRKPVNALAYGNGRNVGRNILQSKQQVANTINEKVALQGAQSLSLVEQRILATKNEIVAADVKLLLQTKQITVAEVRNLLLAKQITKAEVDKLLKKKMITAEEYKQITANRMQLIQSKMLNFSWKAIGASIRSAGVAIKTSLGPLGWLMIALDAIVAAWYAISNASEEAAEKEKTFADSNIERYRELKDQLESFQKQDMSFGNLSNNIDQLKEMTKQYDENYIATIKAADAIDSESERLNFLKENLENVGKGYKYAAEHKARFMAIIESTSTNWFNDDVDENMKDYNEANFNLEKTFSNTSKVAINNISEALEKLALSNKKVKESLFDENDKKRPLLDVLNDLIGDEARFNDLQNKTDHVGEIIRSVYSKLNIQGKVAFDNYILKAKTRFSKLNDDLAPDLIKVFEQAKEIVKDEAGLTDEDLEQPNQQTQTAIWNTVQQILKTSENYSDNVVKAVANMYLPLVFHFTPIIKVENAEMTLGKIAQQAFNSLPFPSQTDTSKQNLKGLFGDANNYSDAKKNATAAIKALDTELRNMKKSKTATKADIKKLEDEKKAALYNYRLVWSDDPLDTNSKGTPKVHKPKKPKAKKHVEDVWLKEMRKKFQLLSKFKSTLDNYQRVYGLAGAKAKILQEKDLFSSLFAIGITDPVNEVRNINKFIELLQKAGVKSKERMVFLEELKSTKAETKSKNNLENAKGLASLALRELETEAKGWEMYERFMKATGNHKLSSEIALGHNSIYRNRADYMDGGLWLDKRVQDLGGTDEVLKLSEKELSDNFGEMGATPDAIREKIEALRDSRAKLKEETLTGLLEIIEKNKDYKTQIKDINRELERQLELIDSQVVDIEANKRFKENAKKAANEKKADIEFKQFKEESDWVKIFDDLKRVGTSTIDDMIIKVDKFSQTSGLSVEAIKQLREALSKLRKEAMARNPFAGLLDSAKLHARRNELLHNELIFKKDKNGKLNGSFTFTDNERMKMLYRSLGVKDASYYGYQTGQTVNATDLESGLQETSADFIDNLNNIGKSFNDLKNVLSPVISLFDTLGDNDMSDILGIGSNALDAASSMGGSMQNLMSLSVGKGKNLGEMLGIENAGVWAAAAGAGLSIMTSLFELHDKAINKEIEASKERAKLIENIGNNLKNVFEYTMGGVYTFKAEDSMITELKKNVKLFDEQNSEHYLDTLEGKLGIKLSKYSEKTINKIREAKDSDWNYYDTQQAALMAQKDELEHRRGLEELKKKKDQKAIDDLDQQIIEAEAKIKNFARDMAKELYGIDFKSYANQLAQTLVDAWKSGANAAEAYKAKVSDILTEIGVSVITQKYLEPQLKGLMEEFLKQFEADNGQISDKSISILSNMYDYGEKMGQVAKAYMDGIEQVAKKKGQSLKDKKGGSLGNSITSSITEETAGLIASYLNAIRADVSVNRTMLQKITEEYIPKCVNFLAQQLGVLHSIEKNTGRNANAAENIERAINKVIYSSSNGYRLRV